MLAVIGRKAWSPLGQKTNTNIGVCYRLSLSQGLAGVKGIFVELRQLRYFVAVAEEGQMTRAARALHLAQPALSQAITQLERDAGVRLFERHARGMQLTAAGQALFEKARATLQAASETDAALESYKRAEKGSLLIAFMATALIPAAEVLNDFRAQNPRVELDTRECDFATQLAGLRAGSVDAEIVVPLRVAPDLVIEPFSSHRLWVFVSEDHRLAGRTQLWFDDIAGEAFPGRHPDVPADWAEFWQLDARRGGPPRLTVGSPLTPWETWALITSGRVVCPGPDWFASLFGPGAVGIPLMDVDPVIVGLAVRMDERRPMVLDLLRAARDAGRRNLGKPNRV